MPGPRTIFWHGENWLRIDGLEAWCQTHPAAPTQIYLDTLPPCPAGRLCGLQQSKLGHRAEFALLCNTGADLIAAEWNLVPLRLLSLGPCVPNKRLFPSGPEPSPGPVTLKYWRSETHTARNSQVHGPQVLPGWDLAFLPCAEEHSRYFSPISMSLQHKSHFSTTCIAKSARLVILTLSGKRENLMHSRRATHSHLSQSDWVHVST